MTRVVLASFDRLPSAKGAARHIGQNLAILSGAGLAVSLVTLGQEPLAGVRHLPIALSEPNFLRRALEFHSRVGRVFEQNEFDVYHVRSPWEGLAVPFGKTIVYEVNGLSSVEAAYHHPALFGQPSVREKLRRHELALFDRAAVVITPSEVTKTHLAELGVADDQIEVVPNAPVVPIAEDLPASRDGAASIAYLGTLASWQGLGEGLRALARVGAPFLLTIRTPSPERPRRELMKLASKLGIAERVRFEEPLEPEALGAWLATQQVLLSPFVPCERNLVQGGMPLKLLDAMAAGLPVVAPDMPMVTAVLGHDHPTYRRHSTADLAALIEHLITSARARREIGARSLARVRARFSPEHQRAALLAVYRRIAASST